MLVTKMAAKALAVVVGVHLLLLSGPVAGAMCSERV